jgi:hypothetical protein
VPVAVVIGACVWAWAARAQSNSGGAPGQADGVKFSG